VTERLYYADSYLCTFDAEATVAEGGLRVYLNRTAFYPASGGQLPDHGTLSGERVVDVIDEGNEVAHILERPIASGPVAGEIDWVRRFEFMQQHSGQHLFSAVLYELFGFQTVSVHLGDDGATVELAAAEVPESRLRQAETRSNAVIAENRPVAVSFEDAATATGLRKASEREGPLRIVTIDELDKSACGGTHVRSTGEIGALFVRRTEKIRGHTRIEFVCGAKAVRRARADFDVLSTAGRLLSVSVDDVAATVASLQETAKESAKALRKLQIELAGYQGRELAAAFPGRHWQRTEGPLDESTRSIAQAYVAMAPGVFLATSNQTGAILLASSDPNLHCGNRLKELVAASQGRGGGNAQLAQGAVAVAHVPAIAKALGF